MGRPTKLTEEVQAAIVESIKRGCTFKAAALAAGIAEGTFFKWMKRGEQAKKGRFFEFRQAIKKAEAEAVSFAVSCIFQQRRAIGRRRHGGLRGDIQRIGAKRKG